MFSNILKAIAIVLVLSAPASAQRVQEIRNPRDETLRTTATQDGIWEITLSTSSLSPIVSESTVALKGANGATITSESVVGGQALHVINKGATNLEGLNFVYVSSSNFVVGSTLTLAGLGNLVELQSFSGNCDWSIDSGDPIRVSTDTERRFPMEHLILNPEVHLITKNDSGVLCTAFISGAN